MFSLLFEANRQILVRPLAILKTFWFSSLLFTFFFFLIYWGIDYLVSQFPENGSRLLMILWFFSALLIGLLATVSSISHAATKWHRILISDEPPSWFWHIWDKRSYAYGWRLAIFLMGWVCIYLGSRFAWQFVILDWFNDADSQGSAGWYTFVSNLPQPLSHYLLFYGTAMGQIAVLVIYLLVFGRWYLLLPQAALEENNAGYATVWSTSQYVHFLGALLVVFGAAPFYEALQHHLDMKYEARTGLDANPSIVLSLLIPIYLSLLALTLLSVAYRRNMTIGKSNQKSSNTNDSISLN